MPAWVKRFGYFIKLVLFLSATPKTDHPFHVGVFELEHNASDRTLELSCKVFTDDFEKTLHTRFQVSVNLNDPARKVAMDTLVARYMREKLSLSVNGRQLNGKYLGFEQEKEAIYAYVEYPDPEQPVSMLVDCRMLYEQFTDQINIFHVTVGGKRQSSKLNNPDRQLTFRF